MRHNRGQLSAQRHQHRDFAVVEGPGFGLLDDQDPKDLALVHHRHAQKGVIPLFAGLVQVLVVGVAGRVIGVQRFSPLGYPADQPLAVIQKRAADRGTIQTVRGHQQKPLTALVV